MPTGKSAQFGFTYLFVLMLIALIGMGLAAAGTLWRTEAQRAREAELLFVGGAYRQAIRSYYELDPAQPRLPQSLDELLEDNRRPDIVRHLRRAYRDPLTGGEFALIHSPDKKGIVGVVSQATGHPFKKVGFPADDLVFSGAESYADWRFVFIPPVVSGDTGEAVTAAATSSSSESVGSGNKAETATATPPPFSDIESSGQRPSATVKCKDAFITAQQYLHNGCPP